MVKLAYIQFVTAAYVYLNAATARRFQFATYTTVTHSIRRGDRLVLYTDGLLEATNVHQEDFGCERLDALVLETANLS